MFPILIYGKDFPDILIKVSKREYLEDIITGKIYFNRAGFFRDNENDTSKDSREGKIRIDTSKHTTQNEAISDIISLLNPEELNLSFKSSRYTPIFCCSILKRSMLVPKKDDDFDLSNIYINEMSKWGNSVLVFSLNEFCYKVYEKCKEQGILPLINEVVYDQDKLKLTYSEFEEVMKENPYDTFFHKSSKYRNQHEFRIVLAGKDIQHNNTPFILNIGKLENALIFDFVSLKDFGIRIINR